MLGIGSTWGVLVTGLVINAGVAFAYGAMPALIMGAMPRSETAAANGFNSLMGSLGTTIGTAVIGVVLAQMTVPLGDVAVPGEAGFRTALLIGAGVAVVAAVVAAVIPSAKAAKDASSREESSDPAAIEEAEPVAVCRIPRRSRPRRCEGSRPACRIRLDLWTDALRMPDPGRGGGTRRRCAHDEVPGYSRWRSAL
ncbi:MAG: MFS transporter [Actinobacteria bacterium]|nr:MFS transporter [Actinomycetota bacterium]